MGPVEVCELIVEMLEWLTDIWIKHFDVFL